MRHLSVSQQHGFLQGKCTDTQLIDQSSKAIDSYNKRATTVLLYLSLVCSHLEYCTRAWAGLSKTNSLFIERVQRAATRYILDFSELKYEERLKELEASSVSPRDG